MMKKKLLCLLFTIALVFSAVPPTHARADGHLDEIEKYYVKIDVEKDASLDMTYHIEWKVLDSTSEGPLTWVKIGIPNANVDNLKALSSTISGISYLNDGGDYVRLDLDRSYEAGETVPLDFSIHQSNMYEQQSDGGISYSFTPGWFDEIDIKSMAISWNNENVAGSDTTKTEGNYLLWTTSLPAGQKYSVAVRYKAGVLSPAPAAPAVDKSGDTGNTDIPSNYSGGYADDSGSSAGSGAGIVLVVVILIFVVIASIIRAAGGGGYRGGFGGSRFIGMGGGGHCACAHACACACGCACACACAGGGRAGCAAKNFLGAVQAQPLERVLKKN